VEDPDRPATHPRPNQKRRGPDPIRTSPKADRWNEVQPTLLAEVDPTDGLVCDEAFGPVLSVLEVEVEVEDVDAAIAAVNSSEYALNTAIYTSDLATALNFSRRVEAGSVLVNMPPSFRADHMPYGGVKGSGQGTEGVRYAIHELVHQKLVVLRP
jgi:acyl-CoA reductase-like NAD-dependent aldehyde dehydrogenase